MSRDPYTGTCASYGPLFEPPLARKSDPESSHLAAGRARKEGLIAAQRQATEKELRWYIDQWGECPTSSELAGGNIGLRYMYARRLPELERVGVVRKGRMRPDKYTGREAVTWELVDR